MKRRIVSRRQFLQGALVGGTGLALTACGAPASSDTAAVSTPATATSASATTSAPSAASSVAAAATGQGGNLRFWTYYELSGRAAPFPDMVKQYEAAHPGVTVELNAAFQNYNTTVRTAMLGGDRPEILGIPQYLMRDLATNDLLTDLTDFVKQSGLDQALYPAAIEGGTFNGKIYGIADALRFGMWFYNPQVFQELGLQEPRTYADLVDVSKKIRAAGKYPIILGLKDLNVAANSFQVVAPAVLGTSAIVEASQAKDYSGQKFIDALAIYQRMLDDGILDTADVGIAGTDAYAMLATGDAAMYPSASYQIGTLIAQNPDIKAFAEPVKLVDSPLVTYWGGVGQMYTIPKDVAALDQAKAFLQWWFAPEQIKVQIEKAGLVSSLPDANTAITQPLAKFAADNLSKVEPEGLFYNNYIPGAEAEAWGKAIQEVVSRSKTPEEAIQTTVQAVFRS